MASVRRRGDKWYAIWTDASGKQRRRVGYSDKSATLRLARKMEDEARAIRLGDVDPQVETQRAERSRPVAEHIRAFEAHMKGKRRSAKHISYTVRDIRLGFAHAGASTAMALTRQMVDRWRAHCLDVGYPPQYRPDADPVPDSRKTANRRISSMRAFLKYLVWCGVLPGCILDGYSMLETRGHERRRRRALTRDEITRLLASVKDDGRRELYRFAILSGLRRSEIGLMTPASFDFERRTIRLWAGQAKRKGDDQYVPMHDALVEPLKALCANKADDGRLFDVGDKSGIVNAVRADCEAAGIDAAEVTLHSLRHSFCTLLAEANVRPDILMKLARHRNFSTTLRYYIHSTDADAREAISRLPGT